MEKEWVLSIRDQCERARVPFFFKQWGGVRKSKAGRQLDSATYDGVPHREQSPVLEQSRRLAAIAEDSSTALPTRRDGIQAFAFCVSRRATSTER